MYVGRRAEEFAARRREADEGEDHAMTTALRIRATALLAGILLSAALIAGCGDTGDVDEPAGEGRSAPAGGASSEPTSV